MYLIIVQASTRDQWESEILKRTNIPKDAVHVVKSTLDTAPCDMITNRGIVIVSKDIIHNLTKNDEVTNWVAETMWAAIYIDEIQDIRNMGSLKAQSVMKTKARQKFGLSATIILNTPEDLKVTRAWISSFFCFFIAHATLPSSPPTPR